MSAPSEPERRSEAGTPDPEEFPHSSLEFAFNPTASDVPVGVEFGPDELVVYETRAATGGRWLSADRGSYVGIDEMQ